MAQRKPSRAKRPSKNPLPMKQESLFRRRQPEFRPDRQRIHWANKLYITKQQRERALKWVAYVLLLVLLLGVQ